MHDSSNLAGLRILVVEDEAMIALDIEDILSRAGAEVVGPCSNVATALQAIKKHAISVASLDLRLGRETSEAIAEALWQRGIPFIFHTGQVLPQAIRDRWPDSPIVTKPASDDELVRSLQLALAAGLSDSAQRIMGAGKA